MSLATAVEELVVKVGEDALEALIRALTGHRDPQKAVTQATISALARQAYHTDDKK